MVVRFAAAKYDEIASRLSYDFKNRALLRHALTHSSTRAKRDDYERLEFLGDRVLGLVIAEQLFKARPDEREGHMSARHSGLVRGDACAEVARALVLADFVVMGKNELHKGMNLSATVLGDVMEALIGGIYLDGGLDAAKSFILRNWKPLLASQSGHEKDAKTFLQEWVLARSLPIPVYRIVKREGPEHAPVFEVSVEVKGREPMLGSGRSKRLAEQDAAGKFLKHEKIRE